MSSPIDRWIRMWSRITRRGVEREVDEELHFHLDMRARDYEAQGMEPELAREKAMSRFGDVGSVRDEALRRERARVRRERRAFWIDATLQDVRYGFRQLRKRPVFTLVALLMLALGIGANTAIFSVIHAVLFRPLPYAEPDRLVQIWETNLGRGWQRVNFSEPNLLDLRETNRAFQGLAGIRWTRANLTGSGLPEQLRVAEITTDFFSVLGLSPVHGRTFLPEEGDPAHETRVVLLAHALWATRFGSDPETVGTTLSLDGELYTVVGILPPGGRWETAADVFVPLVPSPNANRANKVMNAIGRFAHGVTWEGAVGDMARIGSQLAEAYPEVNQGIGFRMAPAEEWLASGALRQMLWILMGAVGFLLLIACVNLANLLLAQATSRKKEVALWVAMGAERSRVVRRVLTESLLLGLGGGALGVLVATTGFDLLRAFEPGSIPRVGEVGLNQSVLLFTLLVALATGLVTGLVPALQAPEKDVLGALREGGRGTTGSRRQHRLRSLLIALETALSLVLLVGAGLLVRSFAELQGVERGFQTESRITFQVSLPESYRGPGNRVFLETFLSRIRGLPQVEAAAAVSMRPIRGGTTNMGVLTEELRDQEDQTLTADWRLVTPGYFETIGIPLLRGENFTGDEPPGGLDGVVISQRLAEDLWPGEDPIGRRAVLWMDTAVAVIGVVGNMRERGLAQDPTRAVYLSYAGGYWSPVHFVVHTQGNPTAIVPTLREILTELDPNLPVASVSTMEQLLADSTASRRFNLFLLTVFAGVAFLLALAGIYGVTAYSVVQRTSEVGIRVALGASSGAVLQRLTRIGMGPALVGIGVGLLGAFGLTRLMSSMLFGITATDPVTYGGVAVLLAVAALTSCWVPARRALKVDPVTALREE